MELNKMREMTDAELAAELEKMKKELFNLRLKSSFLSLDSSAISSVWLSFLIFSIFITLHHPLLRTWS